MPPKKRARTQQPRYDCQSCLENLASNRFPGRCPTNECKHYINTCRNCLREWLSQSVETKALDGITCPECEERMSREDIAASGSRVIVKRYDYLLWRQQAAGNPNWRWCLNPGCESGHEHVSPAKDDSNPEQSEDSFVYKACRSKACVRCNVPFHYEESCQEF